ncbi:hypothetical protein I4U23_027413 [Adineta vaga]|nr:hypothetical protein I4U23_027413 [Adineta vaga]
MTSSDIISVVVFVLILFIPIVKLFIGIIYFNQCSIGSFISPYVLTSAILEFILIIVFCLSVLSSDERNEAESYLDRLFESIGNYINTFFIVTSFIIICGTTILIIILLGGIIVFPTVLSVQFSNSYALTYCHPILYTCAFATAIIYFGIFVSLVVVVLFMYYK